MFLFFFITGLITSAFLNGYLFEFFQKENYMIQLILDLLTMKKLPDLVELQFFLHFVFAMELVERSCLLK